MSSEIWCSEGTQRNSRMLWGDYGPTQICMATLRMGCSASFKTAARASGQGSDPPVQKAVTGSVSHMGRIVPSDGVRMPLLAQLRRFRWESEACGCGSGRFGCEAASSRVGAFSICALQMTACDSCICGRMPWDESDKGSGLSSYSAGGYDVEWVDCDATGCVGSCVPHLSPGRRR
jgi:hypothetical protein